MKLSVFLNTQAFFICFMILNIQTMFSELIPTFIGCEHIRWREEQLEAQVMNYEEPNSRVN